MVSRFLPLVLALLLSPIALSACAQQARLNSKTSSTPTRTTTESHTVNINTATPAQLERLPGIGAVLAERIVNYRELHGRFRRPEHLMMVRGISDRKLREILQSITVE